MAPKYSVEMLAIFKTNKNIGMLILYVSLGMTGFAVLLRLPKFFKERILYSRFSKFQGSFLSYRAQIINRTEIEKPFPQVLCSKKISQIYLFLLPIYKIIRFKVPLTGGLLLGQLLLMTVYMIGLIVLSIFRNTDHKASVLNHRRFAAIAIAQLPLLVTLTMKNSPIDFLIGGSYKKSNVFHRFLGRMVFTFGLIHGVLQLRKQLIRKRPFRLVKAPLTGIIALCALLLMVLTGLRFIRKNLYQLFLVAHIVGYVTAIVALWMHTPATQPYLAFVIAVIGFDFLVTIIKSRFKRAIFTAMPDGLTRIEVQGINNGWRPGQHVYIRVLRARFFFEKHPFTIANAPSSSSPHGSTNYMLLVVKAVGDFTKRIHKIGQAPQKPSEFLVDINDDKTVQKPEFKNNFDNFNEAVSGITHYVIVDGPYGSSFTDLTKYKNVLLCAGGSGFTYCMTALEDIVGEAARGGRSITRNIVLVWSLREPAMLESFESTLVNTIAVGFAKNINIDFRLFITTQAGSNFRPKLLPKTIIKISTQKPDLYQIVDELIDSQSNIFIEDIVGVEDGRRCGSGLGIGVCGPVNMVDQMKDVVLKLDTERFRQAGGVTLHSECFGF